MIKRCVADSISLYRSPMPQTDFNVWKIQFYAQFYSPKKTNKILFYFKLDATQTGLSVGRNKKFNNSRTYNRTIADTRKKATRSDSSFFFFSANISKYKKTHRHTHSKSTTTEVLLISTIVRPNRENGLRELTQQRHCCRYIIASSVPKANVVAVVVVLMLPNAVQWKRFNNEIRLSIHIVSSF